MQISKKLQQYETFADVILHGGSGQRSKWTLGFYFNRYGLTRKQPSSSTWTRYEVPLSPVAGDPTLGAPWVVKTNAFDMDASESHFENVLGNLDTILIRGRYQTGTETTKIRNIFITGENSIVHLICISDVEWWSRLPFKMQERWGGGARSLCM